LPTLSSPGLHAVASSGLRRDSQSDVAPMPGAQEGKPRLAGASHCDNQGSQDPQRNLSIRSGAQRIWCSHYHGIVDQAAKMLACRTTRARPGGRHHGRTEISSVSGMRRHWKGSPTSGQPARPLAAPPDRLSYLRWNRVSSKSYSRSANLSALAANARGAARPFAGGYTSTRPTPRRVSESRLPSCAAQCLSQSGRLATKSRSPVSRRSISWLVLMATPMRVVADGFDWQPIDTAPFDEDVTLLVTDGRGDPYRIPYPCKLNSTGWVNSSRGTLLAVTPMGWKPYIPRPKRR
jgi:hypothetical protein